MYAQEQLLKTLEQLTRVKVRTPEQTSSVM